MNHNGVSAITFWSDKRVIVTGGAAALEVELNRTVGWYRQHSEAAVGA